MTDRRLPGPLETAVLTVMAAADGPVAVADVQKRLSGSPAYTTVMTTLSRLAAKGALSQSREGRAYKYSLAAPPESVDDAVTARRMRRLLSDGSDRAGVLARFVAELEPDEERLLVELLEQSESRG
ncbi:BlaI/MecI/CopY family transcriptional regulator [Nakamurella sp. PAMC28650]|jgi:predicted transcriptional regulator|uniref:BlaI/MecI/CopY family transcriptional regulator n=1 Tax=Nakamurella sp. PAMC28650 TaxID=2762325 RepID=UPI00164EAE81|nr:BlaI/MecI/CopY family transcriptional regulator [Nakamurella sp. PAMC28650]QNK79299.1 BlaI/MecI/CopY family transcriptional regulator [Nakamurella sp. PAMC28650]